MKRMIFGITGGSGAGKSLASECFRKNGIYVADADKAARRVTEKGTACLEELAERLGTEILRPDGSYDRRKTAELVFSDKEKLGILNEVTHKYIHEEIERELAGVSGDIAAVDGAVLIGSPLEKMCAFMVAVTADRDVRIKRIIERDGVSRNDAEKRIKSQPEDDFYIANSRYMLYNNSSREALEREVTRLSEIIKESMG